MATVSGLESLSFPSKSELRQFAELFAPLFQASSDEARRQAVAALSQSPQVPPAVAHFIASQPISIAAPFLASSPCMSDDLLILIARTQGAAHARAIVRREALSPRVIDALVGLRHEHRTAADKTHAHNATPRFMKVAPDETQVAKPEPVQTVAPAKTPAPMEARAKPAAQANPIAQPQEQRGMREEELRQTIRSLSAHLHRPESDRLGLFSLSPLQEALMVRFARSREGGHFATTLANAMSSSRWLAERILLDISGRQLAVTLIGLAMNFEDAVYVLTRLYPQLARMDADANRAANLLASLNPVECEERIEAWLKADRYTFADDRAQDEMPKLQAANASGNSAGTRNTASHARQRLLALKGRR